jgi:hypothetical protein
MATQNEVIQYLKSTYSEITQDGENFTLRFDTGDGRSQLVIISVGENVILAASPFAKTGQITDSQALSASSLAAPVTKTDDYYLVSNGMMIRDIDPSEITFVIEFTTLNADKIEKSLGLGDSL